MRNKEKIPDRGSMKRPESPEEALEQIEDGLIEWTEEDVLIEFKTEEVTTICPVTEQPDFNTITISYVPNKTYIESKTLKYFFWSLRELGIHCEYLANTIATRLQEVLNAKYMKVEVEQNPRGGIKLTTVKEIGGSSQNPARVNKTKEMV